MVTTNERRAALLDRLADHVLTEGLAASSLRPLARAAGTSDRMLLYYFLDKNALIAATLERIAARLVATLETRTAPARLPLPALRMAISETLFSEQAWPYMRIWLEVASLAARGDSFYRSVGERIGRGFLVWGAAQLDSPTPEARATDAARLLMAIEGLLLLKSIGLDDVARQALVHGD